MISLQPISKPSKTFLRTMSRAGGAGRGTPADRQQRTAGRSDAVCGGDRRQALPKEVLKWVVKGQKNRASVSPSTAEIKWETSRVTGYDRLIKGHVEGWLAKRGGGMISVLMTDTPTVQSFNRKYRGVPTPTAVMSFPQFHHRGQRSDDLLPLRIWGDVVIAVDAIKRYARMERAKPEAILKEFLDHGLQGLTK